MTNKEMIIELRYAIDLIKQNGQDWLDERDIPILEAAISALRTQQWIPCNPSELPRDKRLWVTHDNGEYRYVDTAYWDMTEWNDNVSDVVAYIPYMEPEPYQEGE